MIKAVDNLGPHIKQYENEAAESTILEGLSKRGQYEKHKLELAKLKRDNQVTRGQQVFTRDWNKTTKVFTRAFTKWKNA